MEEDNLNKLPVNSVISFLEIEFDSYESWICFSSFEVMQNFLYNDLILGNASIGNEGGLRRRYKLVEERSELGN